MKQNINFNEVGMHLGNTRRLAFNLLNKMIYDGDIRIEKNIICFCGTQDFQLLSEFDRFGLPFGTQICKKCGLVTQTIRIHPDDLPVLYDKIYWPLAEGRTSPHFLTAPKKNEVESFVLKYIPKNKQEITIFEIGCGSGTRITKLKNELISRGQSVNAYACDYSTEALQITKQKGINTILGGMEEISKFGKADVLILSHVVEHMPDLEYALQQFNLLTHESSVVYIEVPGIKDLENKKEYMYSYQDYNILVHTFNFSLNTLRNVMNQGGFKLLDGDEFVRSVFIKGEDVKLNSDYINIINSLNNAKDRHLNLLSSNSFKIKNYFKNLYRAIFSVEKL